MVGRAPFGLEPPGLLHAVQRGIERAFLDTKRFARDLADERGDVVAVQRSTGREDGENEQVERTLEAIVRVFGLSHSQL